MSSKPFVQYIIKTLSIRTERASWSRQQQQPLHDDAENVLRGQSQLAAFRYQADLEAARTANSANLGKLKYPFDAEPDFQRGPSTHDHPN
jgi:hypothetical protein